jgi:hypothetical protein
MKRCSWRVQIEDFRLTTAGRRGETEKRRSGTREFELVTGAVVRED